MLGKIFKKKPLALRIGDTAPDFKAETTTGDISFHEWIGSSYAMIFSHPKDFTPVCSTELSRTAALKPEFDKRNCKIIGLSVDSIRDSCVYGVIDLFSSYCLEILKLIRMFCLKLFNLILIC